MSKEALQGVLELGVFNCQGIDFVGLLPMSYSNECIMVVMD